MKRKKILILNGPNLNMLGARDVSLYGNTELNLIASEVKDYFELKEFSPELTWFQSNIEGEIVEKIHMACTEQFDGIIINPGAYSHTSIAIMDSLAIFSGKKIEVHLSNTCKREEFRRVKLTAQSVDGLIEGLGKIGYRLAIEAII